MTLRRRSFLQLATSAVALPAVSRTALAQTYPKRPVKLIVTVPAGGSPDIIGRLIAKWLSEKLGQNFLVENKPGASTNLGTELALKAAPSGDTLLLAMSSNAINPALYTHLNFNFIRDAEPVASISTIPLVMVVHPSVAAKTVPEFIALAKSEPGKLNIASGGTGTPLFVAAALFKMMADVKLTDVLYQGEGAAYPDLLSGRTQAMFGVMPAALPYIRAGKLRALAVTSAKAQPELPGVPPVAQFLPGYEALGWYGIVAPKGTPKDVVEVLNKQVNAALADPAMRKRFTDLGCDVFTGTPADFEKFIRSETEKWAKVIKFAGVKPN
ncbi:MAG: tripartite tricarboxylate transporter substrate binding protein [Xanthobacteraceae bacterium]|jgi:tripartite-type tricarboxylate transporter receptor subunit TctC